MLDLFAFGHDVLAWADKQAGPVPVPCFLIVLP